MPLFYQKLKGKSDLSYGMEELFYPEFRKMA